MNSCILLTSPLNSQYKIDVILKNISYLKSKGLPIVVVGNYPVPKEVQREVNYSFFVNNNPIVNRISYAWKFLPPTSIGDKFKVINSSQDYGYAHLHQTLEGFKICESLGYDYVYHLNYDATIEDEEFSKLLTTSQNYTPVYFSWGEDAISTACYAFKTKDYIQALEPRMHFYANLNPPLPPNWYCEVFFKWILEDSGIIQDIPLSEVQVKLEISGTEFESPLGKFGAYYYSDLDSYLLYFPYNLPSELPTFKANETFITAQDLGNNCLLIPNVEGEYHMTNFDSDYMIFESNDHYRAHNYVAES